MSNALDVKRLAVKVFASSPASEVDLESYIGVFQRWIQNKVIADEVMIDVADYRHVPEGPGVMLICDGAYYALDSRDGRLGLLYQQNGRRTEESFRSRFRAVTVAALRAACLLEREQGPGQIRFAGDEIAVCLRDRLLAPNSGAMFLQLRPDIESLAAALYPHTSVDIGYVDTDPARTCLSAKLGAHVATAAPEVSVLLERAQGWR